MSHEILSRILEPGPHCRVTRDDWDKYDLRRSTSMSGDRFLRSTWWTRSFVPELLYYQGSLGLNRLIPDSETSVQLRLGPIPSSRVIVLASAPSLPQCLDHLL